jgi:hypothetical protein
MRTPAFDAWLDGAHLDRRPTAGVVRVRTCSAYRDMPRRFPHIHSGATDDAAELPPVRPACGLRERQAWLRTPSAGTCGFRMRREGRSIS